MTIPVVRTPEGGPVRGGDRRRWSGPVSVPVGDNPVRRHPDRRGDGDRLPPAARLRSLLEVATGSPATDGNAVDLLRNGQRILPAMLAAIDGAVDSIDLLTFVWWRGVTAGRFAAALAAAARRGVRVRVLLDAVGARRASPHHIAVMEAAGCEVRWFRPLRLGGLVAARSRNHRKILVVDGAVGFTGGVGIADEWLGDARGPREWRDTHLRIRGPAVSMLRAAFWDSWVETGGPLTGPGEPIVVPSVEGDALIQIVASAPTGGPNPQVRLLVSLLAAARQQVRITTPYFNPPEELEAALVDAASRGVDVRVLLPGPHADKRFVQLAGEDSYGRLLAAGVDILCYQPTMLHAKVLTVDGTAAVVGSVNCNHRSSIHDLEVSAVIHHRGVTAELDADFDSDCDRSRRLDLERWKRRNLLQRAGERLVSLVGGWI